MNDARLQTAAPNATDNRLAELVAAGTTALEEGDLRRALTAYQAVIEAFPDRPEGHNNLGALWASLGEWTRAETCFDRVVGLLPGNPHVLYNRGVMRSHLGRHADAGADFAAALALSPNDADLHNNLGVSLYLRGNPDGARRHLEAALRLRPDYANALLNLCDVDETCGDLASAVVRCNEFLARHQDGAVRRRLLELHASAGSAHLDAACGTAEALLAAQPDDTPVRQHLGRLLNARQALQEPAQRAHAKA
ncbi:MAG: tetratricopeptide repeat protein [bacterium]|nr:tetratricopeptide repeat protein [bacterium]